MVFLCAIILGMDGVLDLGLVLLMVGMDILIGAGVITIGDLLITDLLITDLITDLQTMEVIIDQDLLIQFIMIEMV